MMVCISTLCRNFIKIITDSLGVLRNNTVRCFFTLWFTNGNVKQAYSIITKKNRHCYNLHIFAYTLCICMVVFNSILGLRMYHHRLDSEQTVPPTQKFLDCSVITTPISSFPLLALTITNSVFVSFYFFSYWKQFFFASHIIYPDFGFLFLFFSHSSSPPLLSRSTSFLSLFKKQTDF